MKRFAIVATLIVFCAVLTPSVQAGLFGNFWAAVGKAVEDYNNDMLATGDAVNASLKDGKLMEAFTAYEQNITVVGDHALANSKAVYAALKEIVMWLPNQLKKLWEKFVAILQKIRDALTALNQPGGLVGGGGGGGKASSIYADPSTRASKSWMDNFQFQPYNPDNDDEDEPTSTPTVTVPAGVAKGLGDGWVELFENSPNLGEKLKTFTLYRGHCHTMSLWMNGLEKAHYEAMAPQFTKVTSECEQLEEILFNEISGSLEDGGSKMEEYSAFLKSVSKDEAETLLGSLTEKLSRRVKMLRVNGAKGISEASADFDAAKRSVGLR